MAKTVLVGKEKEKQLKEQQRIAKKKNKKQRRSPIRFFKDIWSELKKTTWPEKRDLINYSVAVIVFILIMAIVVGVIDFGLEQLLLLFTK